MIGSIISHYKILEKLGEGGMGVVYKAQDTKLKRTVALKFLPRDLSSSDQDKARFIKEAQAASTLNHPNISHIYEIDEAQGETFIAMEFIEGQILRKHIDAGRMKMDEVLKVGNQVANGLFAAHAKGIVHRDVKPENIIISLDGTAKITDFGLARTTEQLRDLDDNRICGTLTYMSPEQLRGDQIDHATDIWSLGVVLYEMVTGQLPFRGEYEEAIVYSILNTKHAPVTALRSGIPLTLEHIIDKCLEKTPAVRFHTAKELVEELHRLESEFQESKTNEVAATKAVAVLPFADISTAKDNKYFSDGLTEEIITNLSKLQLLKVVSRSSVMRYEMEGKTHQRAASDLGVQYLLEGSVRKHGNDLRITAQLIDAAQDSYLWAETYRGTMEDIFDIQEKVAAEIVEALQVRLSPHEKQTLKKRFTGNAEAYQLYLKGRFFWNKRNEEDLKKAIRHFEQAIEKDPSYALAWAGIADSYNLLGEYGRTPRRELYPNAKMAVEKALQIDDQLAEAHISLASLMMLYEWDWFTSEKEFKLGIELNPNYATGHHWYADLLLSLGRFDEALREITLAIELDPISQAIIRDKGLILYYNRQYDDAIELAKKALELDSNFAISHRLLSLCYQGKEMFDEAITENERWGTLMGNRVETSIALAQLYALTGRRNDAKKIIDGLTSADYLKGNVHRGIALVYIALGENDMAFKFLEKGIELREESLTSIKIDPKMDRLRADPRFTTLLKKIGLTQ